MSQPSQSSVSVLSQLLEPIGRSMPPEFARGLASLRASADVRARIEELADKCNEGDLNPEERAEYDSSIDALNVISILQAKARGVLSRPSRT